MAIRQKILNACERYWLEWLEERLVPHQEAVAAQKKEIQRLLSRCEQLERQMEEQNEKAIVVALWQDLETKDKAVEIFCSTRFIHPILCVKDDCVENRFRNKFCLTHYEQYNQKERFET